VICALHCVSIVCAQILRELRECIVFCLLLLRLFLSVMGKFHQTVKSWMNIATALCCQLFHHLYCSCSSLHEMKVIIVIIICVSPLEKKTSLKSCFWIFNLHLDSTSSPNLTPTQHSYKLGSSILLDTFKVHLQVKCLLTQGKWHWSFYWGGACKWCGGVGKDQFLIFLYFP